MKHRILGALGVALILVTFLACGTTAPSALPSPSPEPSAVPAAEHHKLVGLDFYQDGKLLTDKGVSSGRDFKIVVTSKCYGPGDLPETCPFMPYTHIYQTGGFGADCTVFNTDTEGHAIVFCKAPAFDASFRGCLLDWDKSEQGCANATINIG